jgi:hypothetical protein
MTEIVGDKSAVACWKQSVESTCNPKGNPEQPRTCHARRTRDLGTF